MQEASDWRRRRLRPLWLGSPIGDVLDRDRARRHQAAADDAAAAALRARSARTTIGAYWAATSFVVRVRPEHDVGLDVVVVAKEATAAARARSPFLEATVAKVCATVQAASSGGDMVARLRSKASDHGCGWQAKRRDAEASRGRGDA